MGSEENCRFFLKIERYECRSDLSPPETPQHHPELEQQQPAAQHAHMQCHRLLLLLLLLLTPLLLLPPPPPLPPPAPWELVWPGFGFGFIITVLEEAVPN